MPPLGRSQNRLRTGRLPKTCGRTRAGSKLHGGQLVEMKDALGTSRLNRGNGLGGIALELEKNRGRGISGPKLLGAGDEVEVEGIGHDAELVDATGTTLRDRERMRPPGGPEFPVERCRRRTSRAREEKASRERRDSHGSHAA